MTDDWRVVFESRNRAACSDRALVLASIEIPHELVQDQGGCALVVPAEFSGAAIDELRLYDEENPPHIPKPPVKVPSHDAMPGILSFASSRGWQAVPHSARTGCRQDAWTAN
jgi:hypothetical protein